MVGTGENEKGVISSISPWPCLHPTSPPQKKKYMNKIRLAVWNFHGAKIELQIIPALMQDFGSFKVLSSLVTKLTTSLRLFQWPYSIIDLSTEFFLNLLFFA
jgi:hypothetical protein